MRTRAFTLLEMLVSLTIFMVLALLLNQIIGPAMELVENGRRASDLQSRARAALAVIAHDLSNGVYRSDVPAFQDNNGAPALAFFTRRAGVNAPSSNPADSRQLSYVVYEVRDTNDGLPEFNLWRGSTNIEWENNLTYPPLTLSGPLPFVDTALPVAYVGTSQEPTLEPILRGVVRIELRFLGSDGLYRKTYNADPDLGPVSEAACITLLVTDERTQNQIVDNPDVLAAFKASFLSSTGKLSGEDNTSTSLGSLWDQALTEAATWAELPPQLRTVYAFERTVSLR